MKKIIIVKLFVILVCTLTTCTPELDFESTKSSSTPRAITPAPGFPLYKYWSFYRSASDPLVIVASYSEDGISFVGEKHINVQLGEAPIWFKAVYARDGIFLFYGLKGFNHIHYKYSTDGINWSNRQVWWDNSIYWGESPEIAVLDDRGTIGLFYTRLVGSYLYLTVFRNTEVYPTKFQLVRDTFVRILYSPEQGLKMIKVGVPAYTFDDNKHGVMIPLQYFKAYDNEPDYETGLFFFDSADLSSWTQRYSVPGLRRSGHDPANLSIDGTVFQSERYYVLRNVELHFSDDDGGFFDNERHVYVVKGGTFKQLGTSGGLATIASGPNKMIVTYKSESDNSNFLSYTYGTQWMERQSMGSTGYLYRDLLYINN